MTDTAYDSCQLYKRDCRSCGRPSRNIEDGECPSCRGEVAYDCDEERIREANAIIKTWKSEATRRAEEWADQYLLAHRQRRRAYLAGRPGHPAKVEDEELATRNR